LLFIFVFLWCISHFPVISGRRPHFTWLTTDPFVTKAPNREDPSSRT